MITIGKKYVCMTLEHLRQLNHEAWYTGYTDNTGHHPICTTNCKTRSCVAARPKQIKVKVIKDTVK